MSFLKSLTFIGLFIILGASLNDVFGQTSDEIKLPETEAGKRVAAYISTFNSGDEAKMRDFLLENVPEELLQRRPVDARLEVYRQMRGQIRTINLRRVLESAPDKVSVLAQNAGGEWLKIDFRFEAQSPHKLVGLGIDEAEDPAKEASLPATMTKAQLGDYLNNYLNKLSADDEFSGVVLIAAKDQPIYEKAVGMASREFNVPNQMDTKFNLGSINKFFTQIAVAQLVAAGKLSYEDKIGKILPDYPNKDAREKVSIKQLLTMTSGIGDFFGEKYDAISKDKLRANADYLQLFASEPLLFEPGAKNQYSNGGYVVLGAIIEKLTGQSYYDYVRQNIFEPAGMTNTDSYGTNDSIENLAQGYTREGVGIGAGIGLQDKKARRNNVLTRPARGSAAGGGYSTAGDMLKFSLALQSGKLRGYDLSAPNGQSPKAGSFGIAGGSLGINANFELDAEKGYTIIVLSNYDPPSATEVGKRIRSLLGRLSQ